MAAAAVNGARFPRDYSNQAAASSRSAPAPEPIALIRSTNNAPGTLGYEEKFDFEFEAENGIMQTGQGELRIIDDAEVVVMRGSYSYIDSNGQDVTVNWYADETGYHAESNILPVAPEIPFEEQRIAVEAQLRMAEQEAAVASSSSASSYQSPSNSYQAARQEPEPALAYYGQAALEPAPAPTSAPVTREEPALAYYVPAAPAPAPTAAPVQPEVIAVRANPAPRQQASYSPSSSRAAASSAPSIAFAKSPEQPSYITYLYNL